MLNDLKNLLPRHLKKIGISQQVETALILEKFSRAVIEIFGEKIMDQVRPLYLKNNILAVACLSSTAAQELKSHEAEIVKKVNQQFEKAMVEKLKFVF